MEMKKILIFLICSVILSALPASAAYTVDSVSKGYVAEAPEKEPDRYIHHTCEFKDIKQEKINLRRDEVTFYIGSEEKTFDLEAEVMPLNATDRRITYSTSDESVATVDENGKIEARERGEALITAVSGKITKRCKVRVVKPVEGVSLSQNSLQFYADRPVTAVLTASVYPEDADIKSVEWSTEDESIVSVDSDGVVTPCGVGTAQITVKTLDGGYSASCNVTVGTWEKRSKEPSLSYTEYSISLNRVIAIQLEQEPTVFTTSASPADEDDVKYFADPQNFTSGYELYQFLDLSNPNGIDTATLNNYLTSKGILENTGRMFIDAAKRYNISEIYLAVHACLESGNGSSELANGIDVDGVTVYNLFGIGAVDSDPINGGAIYAYNQGWTSIESAILGGAEWISENYIDNGQNTLYKMRWNPSKPGTHQYATDVEWASKQAKSLYNMFNSFPSAELKFEFPIYSGQKEPEIKFN